MAVRFHDRIDFRKISNNVLVGLARASNKTEKAMRADRQISRGAPKVTRLGSDDYGDSYEYQVELNQFITSMTHSQMERFAVEICQMLGWAAMPVAFTGEERESEELRSLKEEVNQLDLTLRDQLVNNKHELGSMLNSMRNEMKHMRKELDVYKQSQQMQDELTAGSGRRLQLDKE